MGKGEKRKLDITLPEKHTILRVKKLKNLFSSKISGGGILPPPCPTEKNPGGHFFENQAVCQKSIYMLMRSPFNASNMQTIEKFSSRVQRLVVTSYTHWVRLLQHGQLEWYRNCATSNSIITIYLYTAMQDMIAFYYDGWSLECDQFAN